MPRRRVPALLAGIFVVAAAYHWLQGRGHVTPAIFTDELMFSELARSVAVGHGLEVRGEPFLFPAVVPVLAQAPAWLLGGTAAYAAAKAVNAALMCLAVAPAYVLARLLVRPAYALVVSIASVAAGAMVYHAYLTSEAVAYPVFLAAVAAMVAAIDAPSRRRDLLAVGALALAVVTRTQFLVLPVVFVLALLLVGRPLRRHAVALGLLGAAGVAAVAGGTVVLGFYRGAVELEYPVLETLRWAGWTGALLPFAAGMLVVPGALLGIGYAFLRPRTRGERGFGAVAALLAIFLPLQAGLIAAGEAHRPFERYAFYVLPLLFAAFFVYVERGAPRRVLHAAVALAVGALALLVPLPSLALDPFSFDSPTLSAVATIGRHVPVGEAAAIFAVAGLGAALVAAVAPVRRFGAALAVVSIVLAGMVGAAAYAGDRRMTQRALASLAPEHPDWLERTGIERADLLVLPEGSLHFGWMLESWNRNGGRTFHLGDVDPDPLPFTEVGVDRRGHVTDGAGTRVRSRYLVVNDLGSRIDPVGTKLSTPRPGLTLYRIESPLRLRSLTVGVYPDGWAQSRVTYSVWSRGSRSGVYRVRLELPPGRQPRTVTAEVGPVSRRALLRPGVPLELRIPVSLQPIPPLAVRIERADFVDATTTRPRLVAARVRSLEFDATPELKSGTAGPDERSRNP